VYVTSTTVTSTATTTFTTGTETVTIVIPTTVVEVLVKRSDPESYGINANDPAGLFPANALARRDFTVPAYASACTSVAQFASACSCAFGIFPSTKTVSTTLAAQVCYPPLTKLVC
jgi:Na+/H+ antiporter NhaC